MKKRLALLSLLLSYMLMLQACGINLAPDFLCIDQVGVQYSDDFCGQPIREEQLGVLRGIPYCAINKDHTLLFWQGEKWCVIAEDVYAAVPLFSGFSYLKENGLFFFDFIEARLICDDAVAMSTDGQAVFYYDNRTHEVCTYDDKQIRSIFSVGEDVYVAVMLVNAKWIVLFTSEETIIYSRDKQEIISMDGELALMDNYDPKTMFLWDDYVFQIGQASLGGRIFDLNLQQVKEIDLGYDLRDHFTTITTLYVDGMIYLSVHSLLNPKYGNELWESTLRIDGTLQTATQICSKFYKNLLCDQNFIYGGTLVHATILGDRPKTEEGAQGTVL